MAYADQTAVEGEFKDVTFSATTAVTDTDVGRFLVEEEAVLNGLLKPVYTVPITGTMALSICKMLLIKLVKSRIVAIMEVKTGGKTPDQGDPESKIIKDEVMGLIEKLQNKSMLLPDATFANSGSAVRSYAAENGLEPTFEKDTESW